MAEEEPQKLRRLLNEYTAKMEKDGLKRTTTATVFYTIIGFLRENDIIFRMRGPKVFPSARRKTVTKDDIRRFSRYVNPRLRAFIAMMKDCGMSPEDIPKLKYGDIAKELET